MVIHDLHFGRTRAGPAETKSELVVHPDAVLARAITPQCFESITGRHTKVWQHGRDLKLPKLSASNGFNVNESPHAMPVCKRLCVGILERNNHATDNNAMRDYGQ
jgi:hypothetical protein